MTGISDERAVDLIMKARAHWFEPQPDAAVRPARRRSRVFRKGGR
jgi:hypothetical protein